MDTILAATAPAASPTIPTTPIAAVNNNNSVGSNNSSSSGYGSATTTPVNTGNCYGSQSTTSVGVTTSSAAEHPIPVATVAAVTPFYNEAITATETQRQQYYQQSYGYPIGTGHTQSLQQKYNAYDSYIGGTSLQHMPNIIERNSIRFGSAHTPVEKLSSNSKTTSNLQQHIGGVSSSNNIYKHSSNNGFESNIATKPQAAATPFYSQPLHSSNAAVAGGYFDAYKYKMPGKIPNPTSPLDYPPNYNNHLSNAAAAAVATYQQQYYAASKSLQDANYGVTVKPPISATNPRHQQHQLTPSYYSGSNGSYYDQYDKYMYTQPGAMSATTLPGAPINPATYQHPPTHPPHYPPHESGNEAYRKTSSWHWSMEYTAGNCRSLPPPSSGIPTAAVSPTNTAYLPQTSSPRDPLYAHEKYGKYDKYNPYFHQQQYAMQTATRNTWPPSSHHSHLSPISERISHTHPPPPPPSLPHHFPSSNSAAVAAVNARQNCCSQPFQPQSCYYPRASHLISNSFPPHPSPQQSHYAGGVVCSGSNSSKYGSISDYTHHTNKLKNSNDLYVSSQHFDAAAHNLNFNYHAASNHRYPNTVAASSHQSLNSTAPALLGDPNTFYNDLNLHSSTFDNYATAMQPQNQQHIATTRSQHFPPYARQHATSLLDYRKPLLTQNADCYISQSTITNLEDHIAAGPSNFSSYDIASNIITPPLYNNNNEENSEKTGATKSLNLRDFLSTWNEDEEDYGASNELNFIETPGSQPSEQSANSMQSDMSNIQNVTSCYVHENNFTSQAPQHIVENQLQFKGSFNTRPKLHVGITVDSAADVDSSQYINLPDIVIDIEKSSNGVVPLLPQTSVELKETPFGSFDVEKELDELQIKRAKLCVEKHVAVSDKNKNISYRNEDDLETTENIKAESIHLNSEDNSLKGLLITAVSPENIDVGKSFECDNTITTNIDSTILYMKSRPEVNENVSNAEFLEATAPIDQESTFDNPEQYLKDIEYDNTSHSNESTFEKEYETFINKIGNDTPTSTDIKNTSEKETQSISNSEMVQDLSIQKDISNNKYDQEIINSASNEEIKRNSESDHELAQNIKNFSKFYKRKRKIIENQLQNVPSIPPKSRTNDTINDKEKTQNFPKAYTKKCRKRKDSKRETSKADRIRIKYIKKSKTFRDKKKKKRKPLSLYYKTLHSLRRFRFGCIKFTTTSLVQQHNAMLKERHLPLIKRQSIKKYSSKSQIYFNPKTLKCLSVSVVNTEAFRLSLLKDVQNEMLEIGHRGTQLNKVLIKHNINILQKEKYVNKFNEYSNEVELLQQCKMRSNGSNENFNEDKLSLQSGVLIEIDKHLEMKSGECEKNCIKERTPSQEMFNSEYFKENKSPKQMIRKSICSKEHNIFDKCNNSRCIGSIENICNSNEDANRDDATGIIIIEDKVENNQYSLSDAQLENKGSSEATNLMRSEFLDGIIKNVYDMNENSISQFSTDVSGDGSSDATDSSMGETITETESSDEDTRSSIPAEKKNFNELEELEKELSQHNPLNDQIDYPDYVANVMGRNTGKTKKSEDPVFSDDVQSVQVGKKPTTNDIAHLKKLLESDIGEHDAKCNKILKVPNKCGKYVNKSITNGIWSTEFDHNIVKDYLEEQYHSDSSMCSKTNDGKDVVGCVDDLQVTVASEKNLVCENNSNYKDDTNEENSTSKVGESKEEIPSLKFMAETFFNALKITKYNINKRIDQTEVGNVENVIIPKLSDLCKIALNSSFESSELTITINDSTATQKSIDPELSVEEALAEMYRQAGVASDPEDYDIDDKEAQDVLLINLEEILVSDSDLYVLQCDMNENVLSVVTHSDEDSNDRSENSEKLNTLQLVELLNSNDLNERHEHENDIFNTNDTNVIVINESDTPSITFLQSAVATTSPPSPKNHTITSTSETLLSLSTTNEENSDSSTSQFDLPTIHHEEIVPDNYNNFEKENFIKYLHEKYVQKNISKFHHSNRILKKYKRRRLTKKVQTEKF